MSLHLTKSTQSITVDVGYQSMLTVTYASGSVERYALTSDGAIKDTGQWVQTVNEPVWAGDTILISGPYEVSTVISVSDNSITMAGPVDAINSFKLDDATINFTEDTIAAAVGSSGLTVTLDGFSSEEEALGVTSTLLEAVEIKHFTLVKDSSVQSFVGRGNREVFKFEMTEEDSAILTDANNCIDFSQDGINRVEILAGDSASIDTTTDSIKINGSELLVRLGDLDVDASLPITLTFILYIDGDERGIVLTASDAQPTTTASVYEPTLSAI